MFDEITEKAAKKIAGNEKMAKILENNRLVLGMIMTAIIAASFIFAYRLISPIAILIMLIATVAGSVVLAMASSILPVSRENRKMIEGGK